MNDISTVFVVSSTVVGMMCGAFIAALISAHRSHRNISQASHLTTALKGHLDRMLTDTDHISRIIDGAKFGFVTCDHQGNILSVDTKAERILGRSQHEIQQAKGDWRYFVHPDDIVDSDEAVKRNQETGEPPRFFANRWRQRDGTYRTIEWWCESVTDPGKTITCICARKTYGRVSE